MVNKSGIGLFVSLALITVALIITVFFSMFLKL